MRALLVLLLLLAGLAAGLGVLLLGGDPRPGAGRPGDPSAPEQPGAPGGVPGELAAGRSADGAPATPTDGRRSQGAAPAEAEEPGEAPPERPRHSRDQRLEAIWSECADEPNGEAMRACLRGHLDGLALTPEDLAELVCGEVPPDGFDQLVIEEVAWTWPAADAPHRILRFHGVCNAPGNLWSGFLQLQARRDPVWLETFAGALAEEDLLADSGLVFLFCADTLAEMGHADMAQYLDHCARGELNGSDTQVAFAIVNALRARPDASQGLEFLLSVARSPNFEGRPAEVKALARGLLEGTPKGFDPERTLEAIHELLRDPVVGPGIATHVLDLQVWNRLPVWLSTDQADALVERAREARH